MFFHTYIIEIPNVCFGFFNGDSFTHKKSIILINRSPGQEAGARLIPEPRVLYSTTGPKANKNV